jgi:hypothetical protein
VKSEKVKGEKRGKGKPSFSPQSPDEATDGAMMKPQKARESTRGKHGREESL